MKNNIKSEENDRVDRPIWSDEGNDIGSDKVTGTVLHVMMIASDIVT